MAACYRWTNPARVAYSRLPLRPSPSNPGPSNALAVAGFYLSLVDLLLLPFVLLVATAYLEGKLQLSGGWLLTLLAALLATAAPVGLGTAALLSPGTSRRGLAVSAIVIAVLGLFVNTGAIFVAALLVAGSWTGH